MQEKLNQEKFVSKMQASSKLPEMYIPQQKIREKHIGKYNRRENRDGIEIQDKCLLEIWNITVFIYST